jgi:hypothetical protein
MGLVECGRKLDVYREAKRFLYTAFRMPGGEGTLRGIFQ